MKKVSSVDYYNTINADYSQLSIERNAYIDSVNQIVLNESPGYVDSWLDIGIGDGKRLNLLSKNIKAKNIIAVEPSPKMAATAKALLGQTAEVRQCTLEEYAVDCNIRFNLITALWNVIGHTEDPFTFLKSAYSLLSEDGILIFDANNRFNASHYGPRNVLANIFRSFTCKGDEHKRYRLPVENSSGLFTTVYLATPFEVSRMIRGLKPTSQCIHYKSYSNGSSKGPLTGQIIAVIKR